MTSHQQTFCHQIGHQQTTLGIVLIANTLEDNKSMPQCRDAAWIAQISFNTLFHQKEEKGNRLDKLALKLKDMAGKAK